HLHRQRAGRRERSAGPAGPARGGGCGPHRLCARRPDDQLCPADGRAGARQHRRLYQGIVARRGGQAEVSSFRLPLVASILGHGGVLALLMLFAAQLPPVPLPEPRKAGIEVMLAPPQPVAETPPVAEPPPAAETQPPPPEPPPPSAVIPKPEPPRPPPKPVVHKPVVKPPPPRPPQPVREIP